MVNIVILLAKAQRLTGKEVIFMTKKRQYIPQGLFGFFYVKQYPNIKHNQISSHITIKLSKKAVTRHVYKRAILQSIQKYDLINHPINDSFYKFFIVLSKNRVPEIQQKIANFSKKDTIKYIQAEFEKSWKLMTEKLHGRRQ
jgi:RNase P protein component